MKLTDTI